MRGKLISILSILLVIGSARPLALGKKNKKDKTARLKTLQTIYVDGTNMAVSYIRKNLAHETCLTNTPEISEADAILDVREISPVPCEMGSPGFCSSISAQLTDAKTNETLWFTSDDHIPKVDVIHQMSGPYQWVLWGLKNACCKGRPAPASPKGPKD